MRGTLDLLILRTLRHGPSHGHAIAKHIQHTSEELLQVETGSLYPALHRLEAKGWLEASWELSDKGKRARYAAELLEDDLGSAGKRLISAAKTFQDVAGEHQDAVVAEERIRRLLRDKRSQRTVLAAGILIGGERERRARTAAALPDAWNDLDKAAAKAWS